MKKIFILIIPIFVLVLTGCGTVSPGFGASSNSKDVNIFVGTTGLTAEFAKAAPPQKVFESSSFPILVRIRNTGAYSIAKDIGAVLSIGREKDYVTALTLQKDNRVSVDKPDNVLNFYLEGKTQINPKGDELIVSLNANTGKLDPQSENKQSTITATLCYPYKTILSTTVCIDPDVAGLKPGKKVCNVKDISLNGGQGAPIAVTKIESQMIPEADKDIIRPQFLIFVENKGQGNSVDINSYRNVCGKSDFGDQARKEEIGNIWNVAYVRAYTSGKESGKNEAGVQIVCCPNIAGQCNEQESNADKMAGFIRFRDKKDFARCIFKDGISRNSDAYTSPLRIEIDYGYEQTISTNIIIQKPLKY